MSTTKSIGKCIYCGDKDGPLTREHMLAKSLGGNGLVLRDSSCLECASMTAKYERIVARGAYGIYRALHDGATRRKKRQKTSLSEKVTVTGFNKYGLEETKEVARKYIPEMRMHINLPVPVVLQNGVPKNETELYVEPIDQKKFDELNIRLDLNKVSISSPPIDISAFYRVLAKTGHSFAVNELGLDGFKPLLLPLIMNEDFSKYQPNEQFSHYVGGFSPRKRQSSMPLCLREETLDGKRMAIVEISMSAISHLNRFQVVCGEILDT